MKLRENISQLASTKQYISLYFFAFQTIISHSDKRFVETNTFGKEVSDVVVRKIRMSAMLALFYQSSRKAGTGFSQETTASDSDDDSSYKLR